MRARAAVAVLAALSAATGRAPASCVTRWDWPKNVTGGHDYKIVANISQSDCAARCCASTQCVALSWNSPMSHSVGGCVRGGTCCFLKDSAQPPIPNPYGEWVHSATVLRPPVAELPRPSPLQQRFMRGDWAADGSTLGGLTQFIHYSVTTYGGIEHDCKDGPCLPASMFAPSDVDPEQWVLAAKAMGASQVCLTAHHEGGFCLWPTDQQPYSVAASPWKQDILKPFVAAMRKHNMSICYYLGPNSNGYLTHVANATPEVFIEKQLNMTREVLTQYGPVDRLWWDHFFIGCKGLSQCPGGFPDAWPRFVSLVREVSPSTVLGRGSDVGKEYGESGDGTYPRWNTCNTTDGTDVTPCSAWGPLGYQFKPREADATIQNPGDKWFWHPDQSFWNATEIWEHFFLTWGRGDALILNMPPNTTGVIPEEYVASAKAFGDALRASLAEPLVEAADPGPAPCASALLEVTVPAGGADATAFLSREEMGELGQRVAAYAIETSSDNGATWTPLPPVNDANYGVHGITVGYRVVDRMSPGTSVPPGHRVRLRCTAAVKDPVHLSGFAALALRPPGAV